MRENRKPVAVIKTLSSFYYPIYGLFVLSRRDSRAPLFSYVLSNIVETNINTLWQDILLSTYILPFRIVLHILLKMNLLSTLPLDALKRIFKHVDIEHKKIVYQYQLE